MQKGASKINLERGASLYSARALAITLVCAFVLAFGTARMATVSTINVKR